MRAVLVAGTALAAPRVEIQAAAAFVGFDFQGVVGVVGHLTQQVIEGTGGTAVGVFAGDPGVEFVARDIGS
ncbi:hypothetical protein SAMN05216198_1437 [Halopseudomonas litoralis]|uniref:Uncharacterized protein n=1 Tax=Halopseudomonas litoralis TaxID=797277 RepID=A0A1H1QC22_9GAMM|nr:hypothetical protein [Halopseudomonas litoralis]SDS20853.1 hypothetical protein SAMN05216198_1437 [Halopseudomonas litoralis]